MLAAMINKRDDTQFGDDAHTNALLLSMLASTIRKKEATHNPTILPMVNMVNFR
jgi:hypothetical protein